MKFWYHKPNSLLTEYVITILVIEGFSESDLDNVPAFTNGMPTLFCKTEKESSGYENIAQLTLFGKSTIADCWTVNNNTTVVAYFFKPFVLSSLFNLSAKKLSEAPIDVYEWSPHKYNALKTQLIYAKSTARKVEVLDNLLIQQLDQNKRECEIIGYATDKIMSNSGSEVLSEILEELKLNERTFQRIFKKFVGVTPTQYRRICQFQLSFWQLRSKEFEKISDVAIDSGFADQSHFIFIQRIHPNYTEGLLEKWINR